MEMGILGLIMDLLTLIWLKFLIQSKNQALGYKNTGDKC